MPRVHLQLMFATMVVVTMAVILVPSMSDAGLLDIFSGDKKAGAASAAGTINPQPDVISQMLSTFHDKARQWGDVAQGAALHLFRVLLIIDISWMGIRLVLKGTDVKEITVELIRLLLFAGFMYALVIHYDEWGPSIINGMTELAVKAGAPNAEPAAVLGMSMQFISMVFENLSWGFEGLGLIICCIVFCICFALITAQMVLVKCESYIVLNAGMILLGFGGSQFTKDFATNFIRYALGVAVKLYVMQMLVFLGMDFFKDITKLSITMQSFFVLIGLAIVFLALVQSIPDIVSGIINGSHISTGQAINSAVTAVSAGTIAATKGIMNTTGGAVKAAASGVRGGLALKEAANFANAEGKSGFGKARHMAGTMYGAVQASRTPSFAKSVASNVKAQHEMFKMDQAAQADAAAKAATPSDASGGKE